MLADAAPHHPVILVEARKAHTRASCVLQFRFFKSQMPYLRFVRTLADSCPHHPVILVEAVDCTHILISCLNLCAAPADAVPAPCAHAGERRPPPLGHPGGGAACGPFTSCSLPLLTSEALQWPLFFTRRKSPCKSQMPYLRFVRMLAKAAPHHPVILVEARHVALRLCGAPQVQRNISHPVYSDSNRCVATESAPPPGHPGGGAACGTSPVRCAAGEHCPLCVVLLPSLKPFRAFLSRLRRLPAVGFAAR